MKKRKFTSEEIEILSANPNVLSVGECSVFYTEEFHQKALAEYFAGKSAKQIFIDAGIDLDIIGPKNAVYNLYEWRQLANNNSGKYNKALKKALAKIKYLEAENELLKKIQALEKDFR